MAPTVEEITSGGLLRLLADNFVLLYKARHLSWRVNGDVGTGLRAIIRQDHRDLDDAADDLALRIISLGRDLPPSYPDLVGSSSIKQELAQRKAADMIGQLIDDHDQILRDIDTLEVTMPIGGDKKTIGLLEQLKHCHDRCRVSLQGLIRPEGSALQ